jgi:hypothetical protein
MGMRTRVDVGVPYTGWPVRCDGDYEFGLDGLLSEALVKDLLEWARSFNREFSETGGWRTYEAEYNHYEKGRQLRDLVQKELGDAYDVVLTSIYPRMRR